MPELLRVKTAEFEFSVWCNDITQRQRVYQATLSKCNLENRITSSPNEPLLGQTPVVYFSPPLAITQIIECEQPKDMANGHLAPMSELLLTTPLFFENTQYQFEWVFLEPVCHARLAHRSHTLNEGFRFAEQRETLPARLIGTINTGNDVGWIRLPLEYQRKGETFRSHISLEVLPTKMDLHRDLPIMYHSIDRTFPLWRFSLVEKTEQNAASSQHRGNFPLMWLANFGQLRTQFENSLKTICQAPHSRLQPYVASRKAARLTGHLSYKLGARVKEDLANGQYGQSYRVEKKKLSVDTPENRFIKMAVAQSKKQLADIEQRLRESNQTPDRPRLAAAFLKELHSWQQPLKKVLEHSFLKEVGDCSSLNHGSLVLQQKTGYSTVYRIWQELKFYLDVFAKQTQISMKSVAEIYEVWCFLCLKQILQEELGFEAIKSSKTHLALNTFLEYQLKDGFAGAFEFKRADGVKARLAHEPKFTKTGAAIRSYLVSQEPDIVLEVTLPARSPREKEKRFIWLFDAKYRIKTDKSRFDEDNIDTIDYVPDDAINQMHRYRDALIRITQESGNNKSTSVQKSRPVVGAYALYPGFFDQVNTTNPYADAIHEMSIGAFALLPNTHTGSTGSRWLAEFLKEQIGGSPAHQPYNNLDNMTERLYLQEAARIPYYGMQQRFYPDLTMTVALAGQQDRTHDYFDAFEQGTATWYHLPQKTFLTLFKQHIAGEIRYLALASTAEQNSNTKQIEKLWPVKQVKLLPRWAINEQQAGKASQSNELYYLFELGRPLWLQNPIINVPHRPIKKSMKLTTLNRLENIQQFNYVERVYQEALLAT